MKKAEIIIPLACVILASTLLAKAAASDKIDDTAAAQVVLEMGIVLKDALKEEKKNDN